MIILGEPIQERMKATDSFLDPQLWHACAGAMVRMPALHSTVYYFPQGHAEHVDDGLADLSIPRVPPLILCQVTAVIHSAEADTDEVFAKFRLVPVRPIDFDHVDNDTLGIDGEKEKQASFAKTLTQSDANNGGGFSVPRYCAETIFPPLDYSADPPVQTLFAKDVHGMVWKFRHIYRGTPRRHLLTTGWSTFVNHKKLVAGDSIVFMRSENGELRVGIRRAKRVACGWYPPSYEGLLKDEERHLLHSHPSSCYMMRGMKRVTADDFTKAVNQAARGQPFEVTYYPRSSTPEFVVQDSSVHAALRIQWCRGMRFKMPFETEDSSRISWFMGTVSSVQVVDELRWPNSPWRSLQVTWDEPDLLQNVKCVNPWLVVLVSSIPLIHMSSFEPPQKRLCVPQFPKFPLVGRPAYAAFPGKPPDPGSDLLCCFPSKSPMSIQGVRHIQSGAGAPAPEPRLLHEAHPGFLHAGEYGRLDHINMDVSYPKSHLSDDNPIHKNVSCLLTISTPCQAAIEPQSVKKSHFVLFGKRILTEQQILDTGAKDVVILSGVSANSSIDGSTEKTTTSTDILDQDTDASEFEEATGQCKVYKEPEDVARMIDLSALASYDELFAQLSDMFGIQKTNLESRITYQDSNGNFRHVGAEPFRGFAGAARKIIIRTAADDGA